MSGASNLLLLLAVALTVAAPVARAAADPAGIVVEMQDLDLASPAGRALLRHRVAVASRLACSQERIGRLGGDDASDDCRIEVAHDAASQVRRAVILALGRPPVERGLPRNALAGQPQAAPSQLALTRSGGPWPP